MRKSKVFQMNDPEGFINRLLLYVQEINPFVLLDSARYEDQKGNTAPAYLAALGSTTGMGAGQAFSFEALDRFHAQHNDWLFGHLTYDIKNETEKLVSANPDEIGFPYFQFFVPQYVMDIQKNRITIHYPEQLSETQVISLFEDIQSTHLPDANPLNIELTARQHRNHYLHTIETLKKHIHRGDIYEINYATEFYSPHAAIHPYQLYRKLRETTPAPMSCFYKTGYHYLLCGSPERYLARRHNTLLSQPIKGTIKRGETAALDHHMRHKLLNSAKDRTENIMITDLVRNDLSRMARPGSVKVNELCGLYTFQHWHQLISTVSCELDNSVTAGQIFRNTFPMGSMTGAPKISAMQLIEQYELTKRGIFSGTVGYIKPGGDFDFNVVIRSLAYNQRNQYLSCMVGGAITAMSAPEEEYEECLLKAKGIHQLLNQALTLHAS